MHKHPPPPPSCQLSGTVRCEALVCFVHPTKIYIHMKKTLFNDKHRPCDSSPAWGTPLQRYARHYSRSHPLDPTTPPSTVCSNNTCLFFCCQNTQNTTSPHHLAGSCIQNKTDSQTWASPPSAVAPADEEAKCFWSTENAAQKKKNNNENCSAHRGGRRTTTATICLRLRHRFPPLPRYRGDDIPSAVNGCPTAEM